MARLIRLAAACALATLASAAYADPVSIIGGLVFVFGAEAAGVTLASIAFAGISYGALAFAAGSLVFGTLNARRKQRSAEAAARNQFNANLKDRLLTALSPDMPWQIIYGEAEVGGSLEAILTSGDKDEFKHLVIVLAAHQCQDIPDIKIAGESIGALDGAGNVTTGKWFKDDTRVFSEAVLFDATGQGDVSQAGGTLLTVVKPAMGGGGSSSDFVESPEIVYDAAVLAGYTVTGGPINDTATVTYSLINVSSLVRVQKHLGADTQVADATLVADCPTQWSATDRLQGLCYIVVRLDLTEPEFQGGPPPITAVVQGKLVYDHRSGLTAYSNNAALCVADFLMAPYGKDARNNQLVWATVDAAANACDEVIPILAGFGARFTCNGAFTTDASTDDTLEQLLTAMVGWADCSGGWRIGAGVWTPPVTTITDDDNAGPVQITGGAALDELFNGMRGQFNDPAKFGVATDFTPYQNAAFVAADGRELWADLALPFTNEDARATNLARVFVEQARGETLSYPAKMGVVNRVRVGERLVLEAPSLAIASATYRLTNREESPGGILLLTLTQDIEANYDLADATEPIPPSSVNPPDLFVVPPVIGLAANSGEQYALVTTTSVVPRVKVTVTGQPQFLTDQLQLEWRTSDSDTWQALAVPPGQMSAYIENVNQNVTYIIRARWYRPSINAAGDWRMVVVTVTGKTTAPPPFDVFTVTEEDTGLRLYSFAYTVTPIPVDWRGAEIRMIAGTFALPDWNAMTPLANNGTFFTASPVETSAPASLGTFTFACRSRDSGSLSAMSVVTVTFGLLPPAVYIPDLTPPPTPTGVVVTAALANIFINTDTPTYSQGHGHLKANLYGVIYTGGALPVFADAELIDQFGGSFDAFPSLLGTTWRMWLKWESVDGVESTVPFGGVNGFAAATGLIGTTDLGPLIVTAGKLAAASIDLTKFAAGLTPVEIVAALPVTGNFAGRTVYLTTDGKIYRFTGSSFSRATDGADILANSIVANSIAAGAITAVKLAANAIAVGTAAIQNGAIVNAMIGNLAVDTAQMANASVATLKIAGNAVTVPVSGQTAADVTLTLVDQTLISCTLSTGTTAPTAVMVSCVVAMQRAAGSPTTYEDCVLSLYRDTTLLVSAQASLAGDRLQLLPLQVSDASVLSASTNYTYSVVMRGLGVPSAIHPVTDGAVITAMGSKR